MLQFLLNAAAALTGEENAVAVNKDLSDFIMNGKYAALFLRSRTVITGKR